MDAKTIVVSVVSIAIMCLLAVTLLIPVIAESTTTEDTFTNEGYFRMSKISSSEDMTISWDYTNPTKLTVNSEVVDLPDPTVSTIPFTIVCTESWMLRWSLESDNPYMLFSQTANSTALNGNVTEEKSISITVTSGSVVVNDGTDHSMASSTGDYYVIDPDGDYVMKKMDKDAYVHGDSTIYAFGRTYARSYWYQSQLKGTVDDGITGNYYPETTITNTGWTFSDVTLNSVEQTAYDDLYTISTMTYEITKEGMIPYTATFSQYIVPYEVTAERSFHPDANTSAILNLIPLLVVVGIILGTVGFIAFRK